MTVNPAEGTKTGTAPSALAPSAAVAARLSASPLLVALDIDGTLAPIAPTPESAIVPEEVSTTLKELAELPHAHLVFVTGRAAGDGRRLVNTGNSWTIGNHGFELIDPAGTLHVNEVAKSFGPSMARAVEMLREPLSRYDGVRLEDKIWTVSIHFRLARPDDVPNLEKMVRQTAQQLSLRVLEGKMIFELRPPVDIHKGTALLALATSLAIVRDGHLAGSILYVGDDRTDEDAFRALPPPPANAVTVHVGGAELPDGTRTAAELLLADPAAVHHFLEWLAAFRLTNGRRA
ncbi:MAG: trehalose-phosphatase [Gemmatimonadaceae bacterium]